MSGTTEGDGTSSISDLQRISIALKRAELEMDRIDGTPRFLTEGRKIALDPSGNPLISAEKKPVTFKDKVILAFLVTAIIASSIWKLFSQMGDQ